jgi:hypothetical protein
LAQIWQSCLGDDGHDNLKKKMKKVVHLIEFENQLDLGAPNGNVDDGLVLMLCVVRMKKCQQLSMQCDFYLIL